MNKNNKKTVIFDLDGTLANIDVRRKLATKPNGKLDWDVFFDSSNIKLDVPNEPVVKMAQMFAENDFNIVIFSGRNDRSFHTTKSWLSRHKVPFHKLIMRPDKFLNWGEKIADGNIATQEMRFMPDEILKKHSAKIEGQIQTTNVENVNFSREYMKFKSEMAPDLSRYERWCRSLGSVIKLKVSEKDENS